MDVTSITKWLLDNAPYTLPLVAYALYAGVLYKLRKDLLDKSITPEHLDGLIGRASIKMPADRLQFLDDNKAAVRLADALESETSKVVARAFIEKSSFSNKLDRLYGTAVSHQVCSILAIFLTVLLFLLQVPQPLVVGLGVASLVFALLCLLVMFKYDEEVRRVYVSLESAKA